MNGTEEEELIFLNIVDALFISVMQHLKLHM